MIGHSEYEVGDTIVVSMATWGGGQRIVKVTEKDINIKNGRAGFDGTVTEGPERGMSVWGYDTQITEVRKAPADITGRQQTIIIRHLTRARAIIRQPQEALDQLDAALHILGGKS